MRSIRAVLQWTLAILFLCLAASAEDWKPITPEELQPKDLPEVKGAHGVVLYREDIFDERKRTESIYFRIKILSEEGKKYANVETPPYYKEFQQVNNFKARTIRPDGTIVPFDGQVFTKVVQKKRDVAWLTKTFSIPDVQVGSIIEYRYILSWEYFHWPYMAFYLQHDLFTRKAHLEIYPWFEWAYNYNWFGLEAKVQPQNLPDRTVVDVENVPAFVKEDYMPPEDELRAHVVLFARQQYYKEADKFWKDEGKKWRNDTEKFLDKKSAMNSEVSGLIAGAKTPEEKLRRIYDRVQKIENLTYLPEKTEQEAHKEKRKTNNNVEDVLKNNYGHRSQLNDLFVALARAAGFDATVARITERDDAFFHKQVLALEQLTMDLAVVKLDGKELYLSPGTPYCPFGFLPWTATDAGGLRSDKDGANFITSSTPTASESMRSRKAALTLTEDDSLTGELTVTFTGTEALDKRLWARDHDEVERKKHLEDQIKEWLPTAGSTAEILSVDKWDSTAPLVVKAKITIPGYANSMGKRVLLPAFAFQRGGGHSFQNGRRVQPVYFRSPWVDEDEITIKLPDGLQVESLPAKHEFKNGPVSYLNELTRNGNELKLRRRFEMDNIYFEQKFYGALQQVFDTVKAGDNEQAVLKVASTTAAAK